MTHLSPRWTLVNCLVMLAALHLGVRCLRADPPTTTSQPSAAKLDLRDPKKTFQTAMDAMIREDMATMKKCLYFPNEADGPLVDVLLDAQLAKHQLGAAAFARFGDDAKRLFNEPMVFDDELRATVVKMNAGVVEYQGDTAVLKSTPEPRSGQEVPMRKVGDEWRFDQTQYLTFLSKDREKRQTEMQATAKLMRQRRDQIKAGTFKDVDEVKVAWALERIAASATAPATGPATGPAATSPADRWLAKAAQPGLSALQKAAYEQLAQVHLANLQQMSIPGSYSIDSPAPSSTKAVGNLYAMGLDVVPILAEALDDTTMTKTYSTHGNGQQTQHRVNEIVVTLIQRICGRTFVVGEEPHQMSLGMVGTTPELAPQFQRVILDWYRDNRKRSELERKLADVEDANFRNRLDSAEWLARKKEAKAVPAIEKYIERTMAAVEKREDSLKISELSECALALGQIGDKGGLPSVKTVCKRLSANWDQRHRPTGSMEIGDLFQAYNGMALLGEKEAAIKELTRIYDAYNGEMEARSSQEFKDSLVKAAKW